MDTLTLDNIDAHFSPDLLALMGEWFTYVAVSMEYYSWHDEVPSLRKFFETGRISRDGNFADTEIKYSLPTGKKTVYLECFLKSYGVIEDTQDDIKNYRYLKSIVSFDDVRNTFRENLSSDKSAIFPWFAWFSRAFLPHTESVAFSFDVGSYPLIEAFCAEGYMARRGEEFYWTPKIRPLMEFLSIWKSLRELAREAQEAEEHKKELAEQGEVYQTFFDESLEKESITPLVDYILKNATVEDAMDPKVKALKVLQGRNFWDVIGIFEPSESDFKITDDNSSKEYKFVWRGDLV